MSASAVFIKHDFVTITDTSNDAVLEDLRNLDQKAFEEDNDIDAEDVKKAIKLFQENVCVPHFPHLRSTPAFTANGAIQILIRVAQALIDRKKASKDEFYESFYDLFVACLQAGPGSAHTEFAKTIFTEKSCANIKVYFHAFKEEKVQRFLKVLAHHYISEEPDMENFNAYVQTTGSFIEDLILTSMLGPHYDNLNLAKDFIDLLLFYLSQLNADVPIEQRVWYSQYIKCIRNKYPGKNPFMAAKDGVYLSKCLEKVRDVYVGDRFMKEKSSIADLSNILSSIMITVNKNGLLVECVEAILDLVSAITMKDPSSMKNKIIESVGRFFHNIKETDVKNNTKLFGVTAAKFPEILENIDEPDTFKMLAEGVVCKILLRSTGKTPEFGAPWIKVITGLIPIAHRDFMHIAIKPLELIPKVFKWKNNPQWAEDVFTAFNKLKFPDVTDENKRNVESLAWECDNFMNLFLGQLKVAKQISRFVHSMVALSISVLEKCCDEISRVGIKITDFLDLKGATKSRLLILEKLNVLLKDDEFPTEDHHTRELTWKLLEVTVESYKDGDEITCEENELFKSIFIITLSKYEDFINGYPEAFSVHYFIYLRCITEWLSKHLKSKSLPNIGEFIPYLFEIQEYHEERYEIRSTVYAHFVLISKSSPSLLEKYLDEIAEIYIETSDRDILFSLQEIYPVSYKGFLSNFNRLFQKLDGTPDNNHAILGQLLEVVSKHQPELFSEENVERLMDLFSSNGYLPSFSLMMLKTIAEKFPGKVRKHLTKLIEMAKKESYLYFQMQEILIIIALKCKEEASKIINFIVMKWTASKKNDWLVTLCLQGLSSLVAEYLELIKKYRKKIDACKSSHSNPNIKDQCVYLLNVIDGRSLEGIATEVQQQREDIDDLDVRVDNAENDIGVLSSEIEGQKKDIIKVEGKARKTEQSVKKVEKHIDDLDVKVEEIDHKTMSNAPKWSKDVTKLMNRKSETDWRLLARRLGYNNEDIKAWSTQSDPCMAVLSEIYGTHRTREANIAVLTALQEMNRMDAVAILENAMKQAEDVVEDEEFEYPVPPEIFLSYQWGHQDEVKLLKKHLEMAGYTCWMDIGQMGGGDKLFEKIDKGIRGAKVIICCVSNKYAKSPNCNREVNLSVNLSKPIIPLLMGKPKLTSEGWEKTKWPPEGSMGPIFSEYLFIRFSQRSGEETNDDRYWPVPKFQELLMQLNCYKILPNQNAVDSFYHHWWRPITELVKVEQKSEKIIKREVSDTTEQKQKDSSPEVFISYQWGKQKEIMCLYKRLTEMGFICWMDIHQMGGGDSLYDKIDRGVRGSQVVLCSITEKYTLSANCRREVSLADALKKPIIPMLLEKIDWPPKGPMGMIFTEKLFVNFHREPEVQLNWTGPKFDELVLKLREHIPEGDAQKTMNNENVMLKNSSTSSPHSINEERAEGASLRKDTEHEKNTEISDAVGKASPNNDSELNERKAVLDRVNVKMEGEVTRQAQKEWRKVNNVQLATKSKSCILL